MAELVANHPACPVRVQSQRLTMHALASSRPYSKPPRPSLRGGRNPLAIFILLPLEGLLRLQEVVTGAYWGAVYTKLPSAA